MERNDRMAGLIEDLSGDDLRRTTLQAIDHAYKSAAEVAEATAKLQGALGQIAALKAENEVLRGLVSPRALERSRRPTHPTLRDRAARSARWVRRRVGR